MKNKFSETLIILFFVLLLCGSSSAKDTCRTKVLNKSILPGTSLEEFRKNLPGMEFNSQSGQCFNDENWHDIQGKWVFDFKEGRINWILYDYYIQDYDQLNEKNFNKCLKGVQGIISDLEKSFGRPDEINEGTKVFRDPSSDRHWGYEVIEAVWTKESYEIKANFNFFGGKGEYFFVVSVNFTVPYNPNN